MPERTLSSPKRLLTRLSIVGASAALAVVPAIAFAPAAFAADSFTVTSPTDGQLDVPNAGVDNLVGFTGTGLADGDTVQILYTAASGDKEPAVFGGADVNPDGSWTTTANFGDLTPGQTVVSVTVQELTDNKAATVITEVPVTFTLATPAVPASPFAVTSPEVGSTVDTATPTFEGTGTPGSTVEIQYTGRSGHNDTAGTGKIGVDGTFSIATDFSDYEPGGGTATSEAPFDGVRVLVYQTDADGNELPGATRQAVAFFFATPPVPLIPLSLTLAPTSETVTASSTTGAALTSTGFSPSEQLLVAVADPSGTPVVLAGLGTDEFFADETDGSFATTLLLPSNSPVGDYTVAVAGVRSGRTVSATVTVTADPVPTPTPTPTTPAGTGGSSSGNGSATSPSQLASTGLDGMGIGSIAGVLLLVGGGLFLARRRKAGV
ncbi:LPXTG cell wall anchor domain-containing protein [Subtercola sp. YIM 133946]|uniref:LPXTG cell wall anchor domain-containing protein n=1 Tax=Subtercola sp. YIM 133946 TaxID=3118909 RepID=UPI002F9333B8